MKILLISRSLWARSSAEQLMLLTADALRRAGHEVCFFVGEDERNPAVPGAYAVPLNHPRERRAGAFRRLVRDEDVRRELDEFLRRERPDLAVTYRLIGGLSVSVWDALRDAAVPFFAAVTDWRVLCPAGTLALHGEPCRQCLEHTPMRCGFNRCLGTAAASLEAGRVLMRLYEQGAFLKPDGYIAASAHHQGLLLESGFTTKPVANLELPLPRSAFETERVLRGDYLLAVGSLSAGKGFDLLLQALTWTVHPHHLVIAGEGPLLAPLRAWAQEKGLAERVRFVGRLHPQALRRMMAEAACVVCPSQTEELGPWWLLEAQAMGKPAVVSEDGVLPERIRRDETGLVAPVGKPELFAQALDRMHNLDEGGYAAMSRAARDAAFDRWDPDRYTARLLAMAEDRMAAGGEA